MSLATAGFMWMKAERINKELVNLKQKESQNENKRTELEQLLTEIGTILVLPTGENPTIATIRDLSKLAGQPFFEGAAVGDKLVVYNISKKAILYRPSAKKVINIAPLTSGINPEQDQTQK